MTASVGFLAAVLAFLAVLALALLLAAGRLSASWQGELAGTATLQIFGPEAQIEEQARAALEVLRTTPGVRSVRMVDLAEQERLLEPWLGPDVPVESLPLPLMVDVETSIGRARPRRAGGAAAGRGARGGLRRPRRLAGAADRHRRAGAAVRDRLPRARRAVAGGPVGLAARAELAANGGAIATLGSSGRATG